MDIPSLLPALSDILHDAEAVRTLNELSNWEAEKATVLLRQCLHAMPIDSPDSLATQTIIRNLQPSHAPHSQHMTLSESPEFDRFWDIGPIELVRRLLVPQFSAFLAYDHSLDTTLATLINKESRQHLEATSCGPHIPPSACLPSKHTSRLTSSGCGLSYLSHDYNTHKHTLTAP